MAFGCFKKASFLERGFPPPGRLNPTCFAAEDIQLPLARALAEEGKGADFAASVLKGLSLTCFAEETVGDMKCGAFLLPSFSLEGVFEKA